MNPKDVYFFAVEMAALLFAVSFHESAHGLVALRCGDTTARDQGRITLNPLKHLDPIGSIFVPIMLALSHLPVFGWARPVPISLRGVRNPRRANLLISAAGPLSNALLVLPFTAAALALRPMAVEDQAGLVTPLFQVAAVSALINASLAIFNLIPLPPLDGFGVVESLAPMGALPAILWLRRFGFIILFLVLMFTGLVPAVVSPVLMRLEHVLGLRP